MIECKSKDGALLAINCWSADFVKGRINICSDEKFLQVGMIRESIGKKYVAHKHLICDKIVRRTQEAWIIISGRVKFTIYDSNKEFLKSWILTAGDCVITFAGYHEYEILEDGTIVYEIKNGPYRGREKDKVCMNE